MQTSTRRAFAWAIFLLAAHACLLLPQAALAQGQPSTLNPDRNITMVAPYGVGTGTDLMARLLADKMSVALKRRILVENRAGASGMIGTEYVAKKDPDGTTLLLGVNQIFATNPHFFKEVRYDPIKDFTPIANVGLNDSFLAVNASLPVKTLDELVAYAKANPDKLTFGSAGLGTSGHLAGEMLKQGAKIEMVHVPYTSGQLFTDLLSGVVSMAFYAYPVIKPHVESGALRILASTGATRSQFLPNVPTMTELGYPKVVFVSWFALYGPKGMPRNMVDEFSAAVKFALDDPELKSKLETSATQINYGNPDQAAAFTASELERVGKIMRELGVEKQ
jgi:tripartite-type tricarboxylate transporter receptor subunit TctC